MEKYDSDKWSGKINITNFNEVSIDFIAGVHGYHLYTRTDKKYVKGITEEKMK